ncbi:14205_t:CDS:2, partial [Gigaspora margarita]
VQKFRLGVKNLDNFKKTHNRKAHLKRKFKCKPKPIQILGHFLITQIKDQIVDQDPETGLGPAVQAYREKIALQNEVQEVIKDGDIGLKQSDIQLDLIKE